MSGELRIGDAERDRAMAVLREHFAQGRLSREELDERLDLALTARTARDLTAVTADLPVDEYGHAADPASPESGYGTAHTPRRRSHHHRRGHGGWGHDGWGSGGWGPGGWGSDGRGPDRSEHDRSEHDRSEHDRSEHDRSEHDRSEHEPAPNLDRSAHPGPSFGRGFGPAAGRGFGPGFGPGPRSGPHTGPGSGPGMDPHPGPGMGRNPGPGAWLAGWQAEAERRGLRWPDHDPAAWHAAMRAHRREMHRIRHDMRRHMRHSPHPRGHHGPGPFLPILLLAAVIGLIVGGFGFFKVILVLWIGAMAFHVVRRISHGRRFTRPDRAGL
ncbi:DUF1707 domain-containing protein [Nonomuraea sp. NPDC050663]|uniref:DUF1707 SHOCT-like domain-containing protein n=1 Tax=Nonomuraea sp. NPDC050663 TaxID=3364370 RepID=UPI0037B08F07